MKFVSKTHCCFYRIWDNSSTRLIHLGLICLMKQDLKMACYCVENKIEYDDHGCGYTLCSKTYPKIFNPKRILVFEMK